MDFHRVRRRGDDRPDRRRGSGGSGVFQPRGPDDSQQHPLGRPRVPGVLVCRLPGRVVLDSDESQEESGVNQQELYYRARNRDSGCILADVLSVGGDCGGLDGDFVDSRSLLWLLGVCTNSRGSVPPCVLAPWPMVAGIFSLAQVRTRHWGRL